MLNTKFNEQLVPFGDSHSVFWNGYGLSNLSDTKFEDTPRVYWIGPAKIFGLKYPTVNRTREKYKQLLGNELSNLHTIPIACMGEIDIRVNLARECILNASFHPISELAGIYLNELSLLPQKRIFIWGPPATNYESENDDYPAILDNISRNCLTHLFNLEIIKRIKAYPKLSFLTLFYNMIDSNFSTIGGLADGIHLEQSYVHIARQCISEMLQNNKRVCLNGIALRNLKEVSFCEIANTIPANLPKKFSTCLIRHKLAPTDLFFNKPSKYLIDPNFLFIQIRSVESLDPVRFLDASSFERCEVYEPARKSSTVFS